MYQESEVEDCMRTHVVLMSASDDTFEKIHVLNRNFRSNRSKWKLMVCYHHCSQPNDVISMEHDSISTACLLHIYESCESTSDVGKRSAL